MELIVISNEKIKVMLTSEDVEKYAVSKGASLSASAEKEFIDNVLFEAFDRCGFDVGDGCLDIQMFESADGGCELFVTKCKSLSSEKELRKSRGVTEADGTQHRSGKTYIYRFESLEGALGLCKAEFLKKEKGESSLYKGDCGEYFLLLSFESLHAAEFFGKAEGTKKLQYINEHCHLVCRDALAKLRTLSV